MKKALPLAILASACAISILAFLVLIPNDDDPELTTLVPKRSLTLAEIAKIKDKEEAHKAWRKRLDLSLDHETRLPAIVAAGKHRSFPATPHLDNLVGDPNSPLSERLLAAETLSRIAPLRKCPGLEAGLKSRVPELRLACAEALVRAGNAEIGIEQLFNHVLLKQTRRQALLRLRRLTNQTFPVEINAGPVKSNKQLALWKKWWAENKENFSPPAYN